MPEEIDGTVAMDLVRSAMGALPLTHGNAILCTKRQLQSTMLRLTEEAHSIGFAKGRKAQFISLAVIDTAERPAWMDIRLDNQQDLARHNIRLQPIVLRSLIGAGYRCIGDLCRVSDYELRKLFYVGRTTTGLIRNIIRQLQTRPAEGGDDLQEEAVG